MGDIVNMGTLSDLPEEILEAYNAPFPDESYKEGARIFPSLVPVSPEDPAAPRRIERHGRSCPGSKNRF